MTFTTPHSKPDVNPLAGFIDIYGKPGHLKGRKWQVRGKYRKTDETKHRKRGTRL